MLQSGSSPARQSVPNDGGAWAGGWAGRVSGSASATTRRNSLLGLNTGTGRAATSTGSPVLGLRAIRVFRRRILKVPNPRISMFFWSRSASLTDSRNASTTRAQSFFEIMGPAVRAIEAVTFSTRSALVMHPPPGSQTDGRPNGHHGADDTSLVLVCQDFESTGAEPVLEKIHEFAKVGIGVVRSRSRLRVVLYGENGQLGMPQTLYCPVVQVEMG
jgi:hypothetical protein